MGKSKSKQKNPEERLEGRIRGHCVGKKDWWKKKIKASVSY